MQYGHRVLQSDLVMIYKAIRLCHEVLQALKDTDPWEDEEIDEMLAAADASGDGELQVEDTCLKAL